MLKKIFATTFAFLAIFIFTSTTFAAKNTLGVVVVGGAEYKTKDYYKIIQGSLDVPSNFNLLIGDKMQSSYQKYLLEYDLVGEKIPRKQNLVDFTARSGCDKVLFLFVDATSDHQNNAKSKQKNRFLVQVDSYLCDGIKVLDVQTTSQENNSRTSDLRARRGSFRKCIDQLSKAINFK